MDGGGHLQAGEMDVGRSGYSCPRDDADDLAAAGEHAIGQQRPSGRCAAAIDEGKAAAGQGLAHAMAARIYFREAWLAEPSRHRWICIGTPEEGKKVIR